MLTIPNIIAYPGRLARLSALAFVLLAVTLLVACSDAQPTQEAPDPTAMPPGSDASTAHPPQQLLPRRLPCPLRSRSRW